MRSFTLVLCLMNTNKQITAKKLTLLLKMGNSKLRRMQCKNNVIDYKQIKDTQKNKKREKRGKIHVNLSSSGETETNWLPTPPPTALMMVGRSVRSVQFSSQKLWKNQWIKPCMRLAHSFTQNPYTQPPTHTQTQREEEEEEKNMFACVCVCVCALERIMCCLCALERE